MSRKFTAHVIRPDLVELATRLGLDDVKVRSFSEGLFVTGWDGPEWVMYHPVGTDLADWELIGYNRYEQGRLF